MALPDGLYDLLLTEGLARSLSTLDPAHAELAALNGGAADVLAEALMRQLSAILEEVTGDSGDKVRRQLELVNDLLVSLRQRLAAGSNAQAAEVVELVASPLRTLRAVRRDRRFRRRPKSASRCRGCSRPARARRRCCKRSAANWHRAIRWTFW